MSASTLRRLAVAGAVPVALLAAACSSSGSSGRTAGTSGGSGGGTVKVVLTSKGCTPSPASVTAGDVDFEVQNQDADAVTEAELRTEDRSHILGEQENLTPGLSGEFSVTLSPGRYKVYCPGAKATLADFTVTGSKGAKDWQDDPVLSGAVKGYGQYVIAGADALVPSTKAFCTAVDSGNLEQAKLAYAKARVFYERVEPVAETFGNLDPEIDGRADDFSNPSQFGGFHRIEQALWQQGTTSGMPPVCDELVANVTDLQSKVHTFQYTPDELTTGSVDLINEIEKSKITGEEERYSHIDLVDFQANLDGAMKALTLLEPAIVHADLALWTEIQQRYQDVVAALAAHKATPGYEQTGYVNFASVSADGRRTLSQKVNALAESVSKVSGEVGSS